MSQPVDPGPVFVERSAAGQVRAGHDVDWPDVIGTGLLTFEPLDDAASARDAVADWVGILQPGQPSRRHWRLVAAAIQNTDSVLAGPPSARATRRWCELACDSFWFLAGLGPQPDQPDTTTEGCDSDPEATRTWLGAPLPGGAAVADRLGIATQLAHPARADRHAVARLLTAAQDAGVFGIAHRRVVTHPDGPGGLRLVEHPIVSHRVAAEPGQPRRIDLDLGPGRPLACVDVSVLISGPAVGVHAAVTVLAGPRSSSTPPATRTRSSPGPRRPRHRDRRWVGRSSPNPACRRASLRTRRRTRRNQAETAAADRTHEEVHP